MKKIRFNLKLTLITLIIGLFGLSLGIAVVLWGNPYRNTVSTYETTKNLSSYISKKEAIKDFDFAFRMIKSRHPVWIEKTNEAKNLRKLLTSKYQQNKKIILKNDEITVSKLYQLISEVYAILGDGHTRCFYCTENLLSIDDFLPLLAFGNPVAINGIDVNKFYEIFKTRFSFETDIGIKKNFFSNYVFREDYLSLVGIDTSKNVVYTYKTKEGYEDFSHKFVLPTKDLINENINRLKPFLESRRFSEEEIESLSSSFVKTNETTPNNDKFVYFKIDTENSLGIFTLTECICNDEYLKTLDTFFGLIKLCKIKNLAVDLRGNGGGNSWVANEFIRYLDVDSYLDGAVEIRFGPFFKSYKAEIIENQKHDTNFAGNVFILINNESFSAATDFAEYIQDNNLGKIIGEPSTNRPECYIDILRFQLPNSKIALSISYKIVHRIDQSKKDLLLEPDYPCPSNDAINVLYEIIKK